MNGMNDERMNGSFTVTYYISLIIVYIIYLLSYYMIKDLI